MSMVEIMTAVRHDIPVTAVVFHNRQWGAEKKNQVDFYNRRFVAGELESPSFAGIAKSMGAEAIVVFNPAAAPGLKFLGKMNMQLASKMRFASAQLVALLEGDLWHRNAHHANKMAALLRSSLDDVKGLTFTNPTQANGVFVILPPGIADELRKDFRFYDWNPATGEVRWMCAWDTTVDDIDAFVAAVRHLVK